jgi:hypothetical protein
MSLASQPQRAEWSHRYLSTLLQAAACQVLLKMHGLSDAFSRICHLRRETARILTSYPKSTFRGCSLHLYHLGFFPSPPSSRQIYTVANKQGHVGGELGTALTERATARSTMRFSVSETDVLRERELLNRCALYLSVFKSAGGNPRVRKRKRPVTPCVPARMDRHYLLNVFYKRVVLTSESSTPPTLITFKTTQRNNGIR